VRPLMVIGHSRITAISVFSLDCESYLGTIAAHDYRTAYRAAARQTPGPLYHDSKEADHGTVFTMQRRNRIIAKSGKNSSGNIPTQQKTCSSL